MAIDHERRASSSSSKSFSSENSFVPFPDLTGWRTSSKNRNAHPKTINVIHECKLSIRQLEEQCKRRGGWRVEDLVIAAWVIVLIHILSQEGDAEVDFHIEDDLHVKLSIEKDKKSQLSLQDLLDCIKEGQARGTRDDKRRHADNTLKINFSSNFHSKRNDDQTLLFCASVNESDTICLRLSASSTVHNEASAQLHLQQVASCIEHLSHISENDKVLSLDYFPQDCLAGDNPHPEPILDDIGDAGLLSERFEHQMMRIAAKNPNAIALDFRSSLEAAKGDESKGNYLWTYKELLRRASIIADAINQEIDINLDDAGKVEIIALCLEKSPYTYITILAVLMTGAAWCPIDTDWPLARRQALLSKSGARLVLTAGKEINKALDEAKPDGMTAIRVDSLDYKTDPRTKPSKLPSSEALAYLIWTSGTTGLPKAVGIQHKSAVQALRALQRVIPHQEDQIRYLQFSAYNFDLMILDMFYTWGLGGTLCSSTRSTLLTNLISLSNKLDITHTLLTPTVLAMTPRESIPTLQVVINGGEKLSQVVADIWSIDCCLLNLYGPAEATLIAMNRRVPKDDDVKAPNIGRALATTSCHALDANHHIVLKGAIGELVLGGHQCAIGYIGEEVKTRDKFIQHDSLGRVYKTGDLVRQLYNDEFEYLGRRDDQIKVNGIRIELLEINAIIRNASDQVKDSETLVVTNEGEDAQIINFSVSPFSQKDPSQKNKRDGLMRTDEEAIQLAQRLIESARTGLPSYMIPSLFLIVTDFPRTSSAKIDREALKKALSQFDRIAWLNSISGGNSNDDCEEVEISEQENLIRSSVTQLCDLSGERFDRNTPFPSLGLNSIKAISLSQKLHQEGIHVSVVDIVQHQTLAALTAHLKVEGGSGNVERQKSAKEYLEQYDKQHRASVQEYLDFSTDDAIERVRPVTDMQEALLLESAQDESRYWLHREYTLSDQIDTDKLAHAIDIVVQNTEILRTLFLDFSSLPGNHGSNQGGFASVVLSETKTQIMTKGEGDQEAAFDLPKLFNLKAIGRTPPVAFLIFKTDKQTRLISLLHHALYDQTSLNAIEYAISQQYYDSTAPISSSLLPFSSALHLLIDASKEERQERLQSWQDLLSEYPKGHTVSTPNLSNWRDEKENDSDEMHRTSRKMTISYKSASKAAKEMQTSVRPMLQAAWSIILSTHCDTDHILIGDSISLRAAFVQARKVAGPVLDTMPIPIFISGSFRDIINHIDDYHRRAIAHLPVPIRHIRKVLDLARDSSSVFSSVFLFEAPEEGSEGRDGSSDNILAVKRDLRLSVEHTIAVEVIVMSDGQMEIALLAKQRNVCKSCADLLLRQWEMALTGFITNPDKDVAEISSEWQQDELLAISTMSIPRSVVEASESAVFSSVARWSQQKPDAPAIEFYSSLDSNASSPCILTYKQLNNQTDVLARELKKRHAAKSVVAVSLHRSILTYVSIIAIWKAGSTYLPIDSTLPSTRKHELLQESNAACLLWSKESRWDMDKDLKVTTLDADSLVASNQSSNETLTAIEMSSPAYILFTSGSTGRPKGCVLTHANLSSTIEAFRLTINSHSQESLNESCRFLARSVEAFDVALLEALMPLQVGGTIVTGPREVILRDIGAAIQSMRVTHAAVVPSLFYTTMGKNNKRRRVVPEDVPTLRALIVGGERMAQDIIDIWSASNIPLLNAYGPTETCIGNSIARLYRNASTKNIGPPFPGSQYIVMKEINGQMEAVMRGQPGELCIGGMQVGSYLQGKGEAFFTWRGKRYYATGDQVRLRHNDTTEYLGRVDKDDKNGQVKLLGVRIELNEIESIIKSASQQLQFIVTRLLGEPSRLVVFASSTATTLKEEEDVKVSKEECLLQESRHLLQIASEKLPTYMVPHQIITIQSMPLASLSGKLDVKRLERWFTLNQSTLYNESPDSRSQRDLTETEMIVKEEVEKMMEERVDIGPDTDLFSLGLDSLQIMLLAHTLNKRGIEIDMAYIMMHSTIQQVAKPSQKQNDGFSDAHASSESDYIEQAGMINEIHTAKVTKAYELLPLQESMVTQTLADYSIGQAPRYINIICMSCKMEKVNVAKLKKSIEDTLQNHDIYKTIFVEVQNRMWQAVLESRVSLCLSIDEDEDTDDADFESIAKEQICTCMNSKPPLRCHITKSGSILLAIHHALYDGDSLSFLFDEIGKRYKDEEVINGSHFSDYIKEMNRIDMNTKVNKWQEILNQHSVTLFPCLTGKREKVNSIEKMDTVEYQSRIPLNELKSQARNEKKTLQLYVLERFARLYSRYTGEEKGIFGLVMGGRLGDPSKVHGPCINTVPFAFDKEEEIQATFSQALQNQHVSLTTLARQLQVRSGHLFNALFSYLGASKSSDCFQEEKADLSTGYPFAFEVTEDVSDDCLNLQLVFDTNLIPKGQASLFIKQFDHLLDPTDHLDSSLLAIENESPQEPTIDSSFLKQFDRNVMNQPDTIAFTFTNDLNQISKETSYKQLDKSSNQMSKHLSSTHGNVIGILMKQCPSLYPLVIAVWKSGKAYLPLDPSLPYDRLQYIVSTAKPSLIVSCNEHLDMANDLGKGIDVNQLLTTACNDTIQPSVSLDTPAYIMFTSGSSGKPKGVQVSHRALAAALLSWKQILPHSNQSRMLQLASPGFDVFLIELCMPLAFGFSFASAPKEVLLEDLQISFTTLGITIADLPAVLASTVQPEGVNNSQGDDKMEWLMSGGDQIDDVVIRQWSAKGLVNAWGPTETTIGNTLGFVNPESSRYWVGKAYPTSSLYILEPDGNEIAYKGCIGEIAVGGPQLADGYVNNEMLTRERFIILENGVRVYKTGDCGRILMDGSLECLGRMDIGQVKINSQRVELKEIESQLEKKKGIVDVCVLYTQHQEVKTKQLVAFFIVKNDHDQRESNEGDSLFRQDATAKKHIMSTLEEASKHLAAYMIPSLCLIMKGKRFPLTPNNKVDTRRLEAAFSSLSTREISQWDARANDEMEERKSWSKVESKLRLSIAEFCQMDSKEIHQNDSFHRLGIDSISGYRLVKKLSQDGISNVITLRDVLSNPTIASLALYIERLDGGKMESDRVKYDEMIKQYDTRPWQRSQSDRITAILPCTPLQEGMLLETLINGLYTHHNVFTVGDVDKLEQVVATWKAMTNDIDILRTSFHLVEDHFIQAIHSEGGFHHIEYGEITDVEEIKLELLSNQILMEENEMARFPLILQTAQVGNGYVIDVVLHHALYDGESLTMLFDEWQERIDGKKSRKNRPSFQQVLPRLISQPTDEEYYIDRLQDASSTLLKPSNTAQQSNAASSSRPCVTSTKQLKVSITDLKTIAMEINVTIPIIALYAFSKLLASLTNQQDVIFAQLFGLRDTSQDAELIIGPVLNSIITRVNIESDQSQKETLIRLQRENDVGRSHRKASMANVLRSLRQSRRGKGLEFDALFDYQKRRSDSRDTSRGGENGRILCKVEIEDDVATQYGLNVQFQQVDDVISIIIVADATMYSKKDLDGHIVIMEDILEMVSKDVSLPSICMPRGIDDLIDTLSKGDVAKGKGTTVNGHIKRIAKSARWNENQEMIKEVIAEAIGIDKGSIDVMTPIGHFGLDSIMAIKVASKLRKRGAYVGVADIMRGKTIDGISERIDQKRTLSSDKQNSSSKQNGGRHQEIPIDLHGLDYYPRDDVQDILPLLPGQQFELAEYLNSNGQSDIYTFLFRLNSQFSDSNRLAAAWTRLEERHDILRTAFVNSKGESRQIILNAEKEEERPSCQTKSLNGKLTTLLFQDAKGRAKEWLEDICHVDFTLKTSPVAICQVKAEDGHFLILRLSHLLYDAGSINLLINELLYLYHYHDDEKKQQVEDSILSRQYASLVGHIERERRDLQEESEKYWKGLFENVPPCIIGNTGNFSSSNLITTCLTSTLIGQASKIDKKLRIECQSNLAAAFASAWAQCLANQKGTQDDDDVVVCFGLFRRGRTTNFDGIERIIGNCMNVLPVVVKTNCHDKDRVKQSTQVKDQIDEQVVYESFTSIDDILSWIKRDAAPWNSYLNLLWDDDEESEAGLKQGYQNIDTSSLLEGKEEMTEEIKSAKGLINEAWQGVKVKNMRADVNVNIHWNHKKDCIDIIIRHREDVLTKQEAEKQMKQMIKYVQDAC